MCNNTSNSNERLNHNGTDWTKFMLATQDGCKFQSQSKLEIVHLDVVYETSTIIQTSTLYNIT